MTFSLVGYVVYGVDCMISAHLTRELNMKYFKGDKITINLERVDMVKTETVFQRELSSGRFGSKETIPIPNNLVVEEVEVYINGHKVRFYDDECKSFIEAFNQFIGQ